VRVDKNGTLPVEGSYDTVLAKCILTVFVPMYKTSALSFLVMSFECSQCRIKLALHLVILKWS